MRDAFHDIVFGWALQSGLDPLTERIEAAAKWTKENGPLEPDEEATVKLMIEAQIARSMFPEDAFAEAAEIEAETPITAGGVFTHCNVCGIALRTRDEDEMGMCERCADE